MEMGILDIHTHHAAPQPEGIISLRADKDTIARMTDGQAYSVGIHPWDTINEPTESEWRVLEAAAALPQMLAIGEAGVDLSGKSGPMYVQLQVLRRQIELSERLCKPMVIHNVKAHDIIVGLRRDLVPVQNWAIHGFRGKPEVAEMLLKRGCYLSFGELFNRETVQKIPEDKILAETDESPLTIEEIIARLSEARGKDLTETIRANTAKFLEGVSTNK